MDSSSFASRKLKNLELKNAFIKAATFEGMYPEGRPSDALIAHHVALAKGHVGLSILSYGAINPGGRTFEEQAYINPPYLEGLQKLCKKVHDAGGKIGVQLTHCGFFTQIKSQVPPLSASRVFNAYGLLHGVPFSKAATEEDLNGLLADFIQAARGIKAAGADCIELHMGHGYLLSQFLSPLYNKRKDQYGGDIRARAKFPLRVFSRIQEAVGKDFPLIVKINLSDGVKGGFDVRDCIYVTNELEIRGCAMVVLSGGLTARSPFYLLRGKTPLNLMAKQASSWGEKIAMRLFGPWIIKKYPFRENYFMNMALKVRSHTSLPLAYLGGASSIKGINTIIDLGFEFIALARPLIHDPNFIKKLELGELTESGCTRCNKCIATMRRGGVYCSENKAS